MYQLVNNFLCAYFIKTILHIFYFLDVGAQTVPTCNVNSITIKDPETGLIQCQDCLKCRAGEGSSVDCGEVISSKTPLMCKPCVLGETYSSTYKAGACKDCENCGQYRETKKACTLTSKAVCGNCKIGAYVEHMLGMCKPCSPCCNDGKDIIVPECQVRGVPANMQCSFARSLKCSKVMAKKSVSTATPNMKTNHSRVPSTAVINSNLTEPFTKLPYDASTPRPGLIAGSVIGGVFVVFILPLAIIIRCCIVKRRKARKKADDLACVETEIGKRQACIQSNGQANNGNQKKTGEPMNDPGVQDQNDRRARPNLLEATGPVQRGRVEIQEQTGNGTDDSGLSENPSGKSSLPIQESGEQGQDQAGSKTCESTPAISVAVQESGDGNQEKTGTKEPRQRCRHGNSTFLEFSQSSLKVE